MKEKHLKSKLNTRVSEQALKNLKKFTEGYNFESVSEALDYVLLEFLKQYCESELEMREEKEFVDHIKAIQKKSNIPLVEALKEYYKTGEKQLQHSQSHVPTQPTVVYRDRIVEKPVYIEKVVETIVEKPAGIVEKQVFVLEDDWLPEYWPFDNMEEYKTLMFEGEA
ncbi:MAG: hypothetical protein MUP17_05775 [candidate division Zixibacteria bacterium]|nr:hypothetical protein [candidate division Zixibacteria bacterium]